MNTARSCRHIQHCSGRAEQSCTALTLRAPICSPAWGGGQSGLPAYPHPTGAAGGTETGAVSCRSPSSTATSPRSRDVPAELSHPRGRTASPRSRDVPTEPCPCRGPLRPQQPRSPRPHPHASSARRADGFHGNRHDDALVALPPPPHGAVSPRCSGGGGRGEAGAPNSRPRARARVCARGAWMLVIARTCARTCAYTHAHPRTCTHALAHPRV